MGLALHLIKAQLITINSNFAQEFFGKLGFITKQAAFFNYFYRRER